MAEFRNGRCFDGSGAKKALLKPRVGDDTTLDSLPLIESRVKGRATSGIWEKRCRESATAVGVSDSFVFVVVGNHRCRRGRG